MRRSSRVLLAVLFTLVVPGLGAAFTIHVPSGQPTIQQGIDAAAGGDTVLVAADTYAGPLNRDLDFGGKGIVVVSETGSGSTIIDCENSGRGFFFRSGEDTTAVVRGFTISNAVADTGAGAYCRNGSSPRFEECLFRECTAHAYGAGICCSASSPVVRACGFMWNAVEAVTRPPAYGGGIACLLGSSPLIVDTDFSENSAYGGGALYSYSSSPQVVRCEFTGNVVGDYGSGAGAMLSNSGGATFTDCVFRENGVTTCVGGGMYANRSAITVTGCVFVDNESGSAGGIYMTGVATTTISWCTFIGNTSAWSSTGGLHCYSGASPTVSNSTFVGNRKQHVGCNEASPTLEYCILAFSAAGSPISCESGTETPSIHHCFVFGNADGDTLCGGNYHDNEYADPRFCDFENENVTLCADSPCLPGVTWGSLVGSEDEGCGACGSATEQRTWGMIKGTFR